jgi:hypothetical protein
MGEAIYNLAIPNGNLKSVNHPLCQASRLGFAIWITVSLSATTVFAADWSAAELQLAQ